MELSPLIAGAAQLGLSVVLVLFFVIRDAKREQGYTTRIEKLESFQTKTLLTIVEESNEIIRCCQAAVVSSNEAIVKTLDHLRTSNPLPNR